MPEMPTLAQRLQEAIARRHRRRAGVWTITYVEISIVDAQELLAIITSPSKKEPPHGTA